MEYHNVMIHLENLGIMFDKRIDRLKKDMDGPIVITGSTNIFYFSGFMANGIDRLIAMVIDDEGTYLIVPALHANEVDPLRDRMNVIIWNDGENPVNILKRLTDGKKIYVEGSMPARIYRSLNGSSLELIDDRIADMRSVKDQYEIGLIEKAAGIAERSLGETIEYIHEGVTEREIASTLERKFEENGAGGIAFPTIVSFGENAANPHHMPDNRKLKMNEGIVIDFGCTHSNYRSDATRTFFFGKPDSRFMDAYETVREAQQSGCDFASGSVSGREVDQHVRNIIENKGYGKYFTHRTGHGIGLDEHEDPYVDSNNDRKFRPGNCITIEPGIYIPGAFGIRIEDIVVIGTEKSRNLSKFSRDLMRI